ncbi:MAG TPA: cell envelope integrity protein CreD, partial [Erwinia persicina]|nr:cell envelope integrity protein CreD [Erwinia persicina]
MNKSPVLWKMLTLIGCLLLLLVPLSMLSTLITERSVWRDNVADKLSQSTSGPQRLFGPLIAIPWSEIVTEMREGKEVTVKVTHLRYFLPESLKVTGDQKVEERKVGIYKGQVWRTGININATFNRDQLADITRPGVTLGDPLLVMGVGDPRGISSVTSLNIGDKQFDFQPGSQLPGNSEGLHVELPPEVLQEKSLALNFSLKLLGTQKLEVVPLGKNSTFDLKSNWPHPGFTGSFLPEQRQITPEGFTARWQSSWFANNINSLVRDDFTVSTETLPAFSAMVVNPVDQYQLTQRAVKYAILLIGLTYMAFFLFETLTALRVHPMQYLLVGLSLVMFFLVLLALSEHIGFNLAWLTASL